MSKIPEMVKRVAHAIQLASNNPFIMPDGTEIHANVCAGTAVVMAKAAIEMMMEPTEVMCEAGVGSGACEMSDLQPARPERVWQAMLRQALET